MKLSKKIKQIRLEQKMSSQELCQRVGKCNSYISHIENRHNTNPPLQIILEIAKALNVSPAYLINDNIDIHLREADDILKLYSMLDADNRRKFIHILEILLK